MEWERLALDNPESVPARSGQQSRSFKSEVKLKRLALPQQNNSSDCGCFLLTYIEVNGPRACPARRALTASHRSRSQHFLKCMPDQLTAEHVKGLEKGKGISLRDCPDFLGQHWCAFGALPPRSSALADVRVAASGSIRCAASTCASI